MLYSLYQICQDKENSWISLAYLYISLNVCQDKELFNTMGVLLVRHLKSVEFSDTILWVLILEMILILFYVWYNFRFM